MTSARRAAASAMRPSLTPSLFSRAGAMAALGPIAGVLLMMQPADAASAAGDNGARAGVIQLALAEDPPADALPSAKMTAPPTPRIRTPEPTLPPEQNQAEQTPPAPPQPQKPIDSWKDFDAAFSTCLDPVPGPEGAEMTLRFALDAKGNLKGKPVASYSRLPGTIAEQKEFVAAALTSLDKCLPLPLTKRFGPIVSSRPLLIRFSGPKPRDRGF